LLTLECGHFKAVRIPPFRIGRLLSHRPPSPPQRVRCLICGADKKSIEKLLDETYKSMAVLARKIEAGDEAAREPWEKLNKQAQQLERKIGAALEAEYADEIKEAKEMDELLGRIDTILAEDETD